jgi:hypothetical protein
MDMNVLDPHGLTRTALQAVKEIDLRRERTEELRGHPPGALELRDLLGFLRAPHQLHCEPMRQRDLAREHGLDLVGGPRAVEDGQQGIEPCLIDLAIREFGGVQQVIQLGACEGETAAPEGVLQA